MPSTPIGKRITGPKGETYIVSDFLGRGAFGEVYRASGESTGTVVAVKLLPVGQLSDDTKRRALLNEIRSARQIDHPNVVRVLHVDEGTIADLGPYACMEYVSGGTLSRLLRVQVQASTQVPLERAIEMMIDIAQGARAINEKLVHRDIKPDNVLIEGKTLKIGDFGISKFVEESTRLHTFKGGQHVAYMAPEGWAGEKNTYKLDVYAVGFVFFEILALKHPIVASVKDPGKMADWERAHLYEPCPDLRSVRGDVPISFSQLVSRMVAKRPEARPEWDEVLMVLSNPAAEPTVTRNPAISNAVASAVAKQQEQEKQDLESARRAREAETRHLLYKRSCEDLLERFRPAIEQFNQEFQFGKIKVSGGLGTNTYTLPTGGSIEVRFFEPNWGGIKIRSGLVVGGGWIGVRGGRSANLVLRKESGDDLYGRWAVCEVKLMALANPQRIIGQFGITGDTVQPFGFEDAYFYDQIQYATGVMHVFTYDFTDNVEKYFAALLADACR